MKSGVQKTQEYLTRVGVIVSNRLLLNVLRDYLESSVHLSAYFSCDDLLNAVKQKRVDIILADRTLPEGKPAEELARKLASLKRIHSAPLVVMTAGEKLRWQAPDAIPELVLPKPFSREMAVEVFQRFASLFKASARPRKSILVVDDSSISRKLIIKILSEMGDYRFLEAPSGEKALEILEKLVDEIKFVISDLHMGGMNGIEFTRTARVKGYDVPIFLLTADTNYEFVEAAFRAGVSFYFQKDSFNKGHLDFLRQFIGDVSGYSYLSHQDEYGIILVVEDTSVVRRVVASHIAAMKLPVVAVSSVEEALPIFRLNRVALSIVDINLSGRSGLDFLAELKKLELPLHERLVLIYSAMTSPLTIFEAFQNGAIDYLRAPFGLHELNIRIMNLLRLRRAFIEVRKASDEYYKASVIDYLTGCYNRRYFNKKLQDFINQAERYGNDVSVVMIDVNKFKFINDSYGHSTGDVVLRHIAALCRKCCRKTDVLARIGGDEFIIALPREGKEGAEALAERIKRVIERSSVPGVPGMRISVSVGCASLSEITAKGDKNNASSHLSLYELLINLADRRMYRDKACR